MAYEPGQRIEVMRSTKTWWPAAYVARAESEITRNGLVQRHAIRWDHNDAVEIVQDYRVRLPEGAEA